MNIGFCLRRVTDTVVTSNLDRYYGDQEPCSSMTKASHSINWSKRRFFFHSRVKKIKFWNILTLLPVRVVSGDWILGCL